MRPDWDADSPALARNIASLSRLLATGARKREPLTVEAAREWQIALMRGLMADDPKYVGAFRGEPGLEYVQVHVNGLFGVAARDVAAALGVFDRRLQGAIAHLDGQIPGATLPGTDQLGAVIELCAWAHAEWVRIHPFANGDGRVARLWVNSLAMRYGLPPFVRIRPRPGGDYGKAGERAMRGDFAFSIPVFRAMLDEVLSLSGSAHE